ncbi:hypothetical protein [Fischerella thermalis]|nr:hypothetical protein [Fischerella thermalis]
MNHIVAAIAVGLLTAIVLVCSLCSLRFNYQAIALLAISPPTLT